MLDKVNLRNVTILSIHSCPKSFKFFFLLICLLPVLSFRQVYQKYSLQKDKLIIQLSEGVLTLTPLSEKAIRVQWEKDKMKEEQEFVLINKLPVPAFKLSDAGGKLKLTTSAVTVSFDKQTNAIEYADNNGKIFLREKAGSRKLQPNTIGGQDYFVVEQTFDSPKDQFLFGLGQFHDCICKSRFYCTNG